MPHLRDIVHIGDPILRRKAEEVRRFDYNLTRLLEDMIYTMDEAKGVGLAAPQIGISKRIVVIRWEENLIEMINPLIVFQDGHEDGEEYCLSVPGRGGIVSRSSHVKVKAKDRNDNDVNWEANDYLARIFQHEIDHLNGRLFTDIMKAEIPPQ
jgi:peptide deformylase